MEEAVAESSTRREECWETVNGLVEVVGESSHHHCVVKLHELHTLVRGSTCEPVVKVVEVAGVVTLNEVGDVGVIPPRGRGWCEGEGGGKTLRYTPHVGFAVLFGGCSRDGCGNPKEGVVEILGGHATVDVTCECRRSSGTEGRHRVGLV